MHEDLEWDIRSLWVATLTDGVRPLLRILCTSCNVDMVFDKLRSHIPDPIE